MADGGAILGKMIEASRSGGEIPDATALAALNISAGKVGRALFDVETVLENAACSIQSREELLKTAPAPGLLVVADVVGGGLGMLSIDALLINALVELATGAAENSVCLDQRAPTAIDAALCREFCERMLGAFPRELTQVAGYPAVPNLSYLGHETDVARLAFKLDDTKFRHMSAHISFQAGTRGGNFSLWLPQNIWCSKKKNAATSTGDAWRAQLTSNVFSAPLLLRADLDAVTLPLSAALTLKPSDIVPVSPGALSAIVLVSDRGIGLLTGRLGQINGKKAVCTNGKYKDGSRIVEKFAASSPEQLTHMPNLSSEAEMGTDTLATEFEQNADINVDGMGS